MKMTFNEKLSFNIPAIAAFTALAKLSDGFWEYIIILAIVVFVASVLALLIPRYK